MSTALLCAPDVEPDELAPIEDIIDDARNGRMFILIHGEGDEAEGDLVLPAQMVTPHAINFMATHGRGLVCLALNRARADALGLHRMGSSDREAGRAAFTVSIEARHGVSTGISAADRARTIATAIDAANSPDDIVTPGHVFPIIAREGGVLVRAGHAEAAVDVARLAGINASGVICPIISDDGTMARMTDLLALADRHGLRVGSVSDLIAYRRQHDRLVAQVAQTQITYAQSGEWRARVYFDSVNRIEHLVLQKGSVDPARPTLVRVQGFSIFSDIFTAQEEPHGLSWAMDAIAMAGAGIVVIIRDQSENALARAAQRFSSHDADEMDQLAFGIGAQILSDLGVRDMILLTRSARHLVGLDGHGLRVVAAHAPL
jgi:3,4-dihydroxy 2-butanone 4-phosphate synthase/GTP cyclohydrolase II